MQNVDNESESAVDAYSYLHLGHFPSATHFKQYSSFFILFMSKGNTLKWICWVTVIFSPMASASPNDQMFPFVSIKGNSLNL